MEGSRLDGLRGNRGTVSYEHCPGRGHGRAAQAGRGAFGLGLTVKTNAFISLPCFLLRPGAEGTRPFCCLCFLALLSCVCV